MRNDVTHFHTMSASTVRVSISLSSNASHNSVITHAKINITATTISTEVSREESECLVANAIPSITSHKLNRPIKSRSRSRGSVNFIRMIVPCSAIW